MQEDDAELAKKLAALKWHEKELEVRKLLAAKNDRPHIRAADKCLITPTDMQQYCVT